MLLCACPAAPQQVTSAVKLFEIACRKSGPEKKMVVAAALDSDKWLWLKKPVPKWNPGKWKHGPKPVCPFC